MYVRLATAAAVLALIVATPAFAQDARGDTMDTSGDSITIGAGAGYIPDYEGSDDYRVVPVPGAIGTVSGFGFTLAGNRGSVDLIPDSGSSNGLNFELGPIGVVNFNRTNIKSIDDPRIKALGEVDTAIELGVYVGVGKTGVITSPYDRLSVSLSFRQDVTSTHSSAVWQPTVTYFTPLSRKAGVGIIASAEHAGDGYANTYFSVGPAQSIRSGLPVYSADGGWKSYSIGAIGTVALSGDLLHGFKLVGGANYKRMLNDFGDSPLTRIAGERGQWGGVLGLAYTF